MSIMSIQYYKYKVLSRQLALMAVLRLNMISYIYIRHINTDKCPHIVLVLSYGHRWQMFSPYTLHMQMVKLQMSSLYVD